MPASFETMDSGPRDDAAGPILLVLAAKYRDLDIEAAARLHADSSGLAPQLLASSFAVNGSVVLSTCNRFEIYCEVVSGTEVATARSAALGFVGRCTGLAVQQLTALFEDHHGATVAEHLFAVAAGLDSSVVGEREVAGQVRRSLTEAQVAGTASGRLVRLFQGALRTAKNVGARTALGSAGRSIASVALDIAAGSGQRALANTSVVLFGTGVYASCVAEILRSRGCTTISVFSQSGRSDEFVAARGGRALTARELPPAIARADVIVGCSGAGARVSAATLANWREDAGRSLTVIDLAPSHDFDPQVAELSGVELITLASVQLAAPSADIEALHLARALVRQAARHFEDHEEIRAVDTAIVALRRHLQEVLEAEMERVRKQHGCSAPADEVNFALRRVVRRLLHIPTVRARELAAAGRRDDYTAALDALFGISVEPANPRPPCSGSLPGLNQPRCEATEPDTAAS